MSESISVKSFEMWYSTYGSFGQHDAQHPLFLVQNRLLTADEALNKGLVTVKVEDKHSAKNYGFKRIYTLLKPIDAVILASCGASSRRHWGDCKAVFGEAKIEDWLSPEGNKLGWIINGKWAVRGCVKGLKPQIEDFEAWRAKIKARQEADELAKTQPNIIVQVKPTGITISGDTYHHRQNIKLAIRACGGIPNWSPLDRAWIAKNVDPNQLIAKLEELLPPATRMEVER